jgi:hypothetical protein
VNSGEAGELHLVIPNLPMICVRDYSDPLSQSHMHAADWLISVQNFVGGLLVPYQQLGECSWQHMFGCCGEHKEASWPVAMPSAIPLCLYEMVR